MYLEKHNLNKNEIDPKTNNKDTYIFQEILSILYLLLVLALNSIASTPHKENAASIILDQTRDNSYKNTPIIWYNKSEVPTYSAFCCKIALRMIDQTDNWVNDHNKTYFDGDKVDNPVADAEVNERFGVTWGEEHDAITRIVKVGRQADTY